MVQIGNVPEIKAVKKHLEELKEKGLVSEWELPYENILTRLTAAIFFLTPKDDSKLEEIWNPKQTRWEKRECMCTVKLHLLRSSKEILW